jgi:alpha-tubulin suppressor-like RCC1 family protein
LFINSDALYQKMLLSWGAGLNGQLGTGTEAFSVGTPSPVAVLSDEEIIQINANSDISAALTIKG